MQMSDVIADMLTRIRNANIAKHDTVDIPASRMKNSIAQILLDEGFIRSFEIVENGDFKDIRITLNTYGHLYPNQQRKVANLLDEENQIDAIK